MQISMRADISGMQDRLRRMQHGLRDRAIAAAINRTATQAKTAAVRDIGNTFNLKRADIRERIRVSRASARGIVIQAALTAPGKRSMNLVRFLEQKVGKRELARRARNGALGLYVKVRRDRPAKLLSGPVFVGNQGRTLFRRVGKGRLPIEPLQTVDVPQAMFSKIGTDNLRKAVRDVFPKNLRHEIDRLMAGIGV